MIAKEFALQTYIANSSVALNYANAYYARSQGDLWQPNFDVNGKTGILFRKSFVDTNQAKFDYFKSSQMFDATFEEWKKVTISSLRAHGLYNENLANSLDGYFGSLYQSFMRNLSFIPGSSTSSAVQPLSVPSVPF